MKECEFCGNKLPGGCFGMASEHPECEIKVKPKGLAWKIGYEIWLDLSGRGGIKHELGACEPHIQAEIVKKMGSIALKETKKALS